MLHHSPLSFPVPRGEHAYLHALFPLSFIVLSQDNMVKSNIDKKFSAHYDAVEAELKSSTVGEYLLHQNHCGPGQLVVIL